MALPSTMKAHHLVSYNTPYKLVNVPLPQLKSPYDILLRVTAASYCHTDLVIAQGNMPPNPPSFPHIGCHEFAGEVCALPSSSASPFALGDRVGVPGRSYLPCGECKECLEQGSEDSDDVGFSMYCAKSKSNGISKDGGFAEYVVVDWRQCARVPEGMDDTQAATMMCAGVTVYQALKRCGLRSGQRVGIMGCGGGLGHLGLQFAKAMGLKVVGVEAGDGPLKVAEGLNTGARLVDARTQKVEDIVAELGKEDGTTIRGESGVDAVLILPESQRAFDYGIKLVKNHGKCIVVSFPASGFHFSCQDIVFRDIQIIGSLVGTAKTLRETVEFAAKHGVKSILQTYPLDKLNELVDKYHEGGGGKLVVDLTQK
ncbi:Alcohol dehydrogenase 3, mitochondrial [Sphaceloma murrayae]|uniref:Alcohol dehydrogenase 3, mitochondrial n=1 Tax=Sphaceloma murrayae TaxID=2082308 RepID=A0A2K1QZP0_9PEZI|nr:Alcohol dehydrogenase 3, mitochondrial [Sphaceloma murrayae]